MEISENSHQNQTSHRKLDLRANFVVSLLCLQYPSAADNKSLTPMMLMNSRLLTILLTTTVLIQKYSAQAFLPSRIRSRATFLSHNHSHGDIPPAGEDASHSEEYVSVEDARKAKMQFKGLVEQAMSIEDPGHLPKLLANNVELVIALKGKQGIKAIEEIVQEAQDKGQDYLTQTMSTIEAIISFTEDFVEEVKDLDSQNKELVGRILKLMTSDEDSDRDKEELLDELMKEERENFTPGFLRHLEGECKRISSAASYGPESDRLIEVLRVIQTRVLEELGKDMGEAALVLGQLMGYDDENELIGVLDAGLAVRGVDFALEMSDLSKEALDGFQRVPGGVDPDLVQRVQRIDSRLNEFLEETKSFQ